MGLIYTTQSDVMQAKIVPSESFSCLFYTFFFYFASMFLSSTGNLPSQTLNLL